MTFTLSIPGQNARAEPPGPDRLTAADRNSIRAFVACLGFDWSVAFHTDPGGDQTAILVPAAEDARSYALHREGRRILVAACTEDRYDVLGAAPSMALALAMIPQPPPIWSPASFPGT